MLWNDLSTLLGIAGLVVGLIGIIVSVFLYFRSKNKKILEYKIDSTQLITESMTSIPNLKVTIDDQSIDSLISTTIEFSNPGNESILYSEFAAKDPLGISITGHLYSDDVSADNPNSMPSMQPVNDNTYYIVFDFLKPKQSFSIKLLHSGTLSILGELKSGKMRETPNKLLLMKFTIVFLLLYIFLTTFSVFKDFKVMLDLIF